MTLRCQVCAARQLALALNSGPAGHRFTCPLGVSNFWLTIRVRGIMVGLAFVQALTGRRAQPRRRFDRAAHLLKLMVRCAETADLAELRKRDRTQAVIEARAHGQEEARMRRELCRVLPTACEYPASAAPLHHSAQVVRRILELINQHYAKPITLRFCADRLDLHPSYLSTLFSRAIGLPFKAYVTELRLEKARQLLGDPTKRIAAVAAAVGYANENCFRVAFKAATGLAPAAWREALTV